MIQRQSTPDNLQLQSRGLGLSSSSNSFNARTPQAVTVEGEAETETSTGIYVVGSRNDKDKEDFTELHIRIKRLEELLSQRDAISGTSGEASLTRNLNDLVTRVQQVEDHIAKHVSSEVSEPNRSLEDEISQVVPRLRNAPDKVKIYGYNHWVHAAEQVSNDAKLFAAKNNRNTDFGRRKIRCHRGRAYCSRYNNRNG